MQTITFKRAAEEFASLKIETSADFDAMPNDQMLDFLQDAIEYLRNLHEEIEQIMIDEITEDQEDPGCAAAPANH